MLFIDDIWDYHIFKYVNLKLFKLYEIKSICKYFNTLLQYYKPTSKYTKYIKVPTIEYPTLNHAYNLLKKCKDNNKIIPEIWLDEGIHHNNIKCIEFPIMIAGINNITTIIQNCLQFKMKDFYYGRSHLSHLTINKSKTDGIVVINSKINIQHCIISNNAQSGLHIWNNSEFALINCKVNGNKSGLIVGNKTKGKIKNIKCYDNKETGMGFGGWDYSQIKIKGKYTQIYNNNIDKMKYCAGISCDYSATIQIYNLKKIISNNNFNNYFLRGKTCKIIFINKNSEPEIVQNRTLERDYYY